jgi:hypothetical protein
LRLFHRFATEMSPGAEQSSSARTISTPATPCPWLTICRVAAVEHNKVKLAQKISAITTRAFVSPDQREE